MPLPTKKELMISGVSTVAECYGMELSDDDVNLLLQIPYIQKAAEKDAEIHLEWGRNHDNDLSNCEIPHDNLFHVFGVLFN